MVPTTVAEQRKEEPEGCFPPRGRAHDVLALYLEPGEAASASPRLLVNMAPENQAGISFLLQQGTPGPRSEPGSSHLDSAVKEVKRVPLG